MSSIVDDEKVSTKNKRGQKKAYNRNESKEDKEGNDEIKNNKKKLNLLLQQILSVDSLPNYSFFSKIDAALFVKIFLTINSCFTIIAKPDFRFWWTVYLLFHSNFSQVLHTISISLTVTLAVWRYIAIK